MRILKILFVFSIVLYLASCQKERFIADSDAKLKFSVDTVYFDTVFTRLSTATRRFTVKNPYKESIRISSVTLAGGKNSVYRINFDGLTGTDFRDIEIPPKDSLYLFVQATLGENNDPNILLQQDSIVFVTNSNIQDIDLMAWGQDVHIIRDSTFSSQTWTSEKPYLILGFAELDSLQTLTIEPGTKIYFHRDAYLLIGGSLKVNGTKEKPVIFRGDRLEEMYNDIPGQWTGILMLPWSRQNAIDYAEIRCGLLGLVLLASNQSFEENVRVDLSINNTKIQHVSSFGIRAVYSDITGFNDLITNCGISAMTFEGGGSYEFSHTTIANWFEYKTRNTPSLIFTNNATFKNSNNQDVLYVKPLEKMSFRNSIIYGGYDSEIFWNENSSESMNYNFENCLLKFDTTNLNLKYFTNCIYYKDPSFLNIKKYDFHFDTLQNNISPARDIGNLTFGQEHSLDLDGKSRIADGKPDAGAYEFSFPN